jgi:flagellar biosynthesis/type III secretory pathway chaperone
MDQELTASFDLLEQRLALMRELARSLEQVQTTLVHSNLRGIECHTARQRELCEALRQLESEVQSEVTATKPSNPISADSPKRTTWAQIPEGLVSPVFRQRWETLAQELTLVEMRVRHLNLTYGALLRRAQRTLQIFMRVLASSANTYARPNGAPIIAPSTLREVSHV